MGIYTYIGLMILGGLGIGAYHCEEEGWAVFFFACATLLLWVTSGFTALPR